MVCSLGKRSGLLEPIWVYIVLLDVVKSDVVNTHHLDTFQNFCTKGDLLVMKAVASSFSIGCFERKICSRKVQLYPCLGTPSEKGFKIRG